MGNRRPPPRAAAPATRGERLTRAPVDLPLTSTGLVTGGPGFPGSHLCEELLRRGNRVICVDNFETGSLANIEHIRADEFRHLSVAIIQPYFIDEPVDFLYHLASPASPLDY